MFVHFDRGKKLYPVGRVVGYDGEASSDDVEGFLIVSADEPHPTA